jgi:hypothetical protein
MLGYLMAATHYKFDELIKMDGEIRAFLFFWVKEVEEERLRSLNRFLGVNFTAGEIRTWAAKEGKGGAFKDSDQIFIPLSIAIRPELRDGLMKLVGGVRLPEGYIKKPNEVVVDMGQVTPQEFIDFVNKYRKTGTPTPPQ